MIKIIKQNYYYFILFVLIMLLYWFIFFPSIYSDAVAHYGFSHAIVNGEIPYLDFNLISTPLYSFIMSLGLLLCDNFIVFLIENALLVTILFYFLHKMYNEKVLLLLAIVVLSYGSIIGATYNILILLLLVLILYFEKNYSNKDLLIGILIGLAILSKHTIGLLFIIPSFIFYYKDYKKVFKRLFGIFIVLGIFAIYLLITKSFGAFIDLCILGLFDFAGNNSRPFSIWHIMSLLLFVVSIIITIKNRKNILNYYFILCIIFAIPIFDFHHFSYYLFCITLMLLQYFNYNLKRLKLVIIFLILFVSILMGFGAYMSYKPTIIKKIPKFNYLLMPEENYDNSVLFFDYYDKHKGATVLSYSKMMYDISRGNKIDYYDVLFYGNHGYHGTDKMIKIFNKNHDSYYIVDMSSYNSSSYSQFNKVFVDYVRNNSKLIEKKYIFEVYYKE